MIKWLARLFATCALLVSSTSAFAYYSPLVFIPSQPVAGRPVAVRVGFGICDILVVASSMDRELVVAGSTIRVTAIGVEAPDLVFCNYPANGYADFDIGPLSAGRYSVEIYRRDLFDPTYVQLVRTSTLDVGQAPALPVPWLAKEGALVLIVMTILAGLMRQRKKLRRKPTGR